jgi:hypothetical protein
MTPRRNEDTMKKKTKESADIPQNEGRSRPGKGETVAVTVRLAKADWKRLRQFAMDESETLQTIAVNGFNRELIAKGYPPLSGDAAKP